MSEPNNPVESEAQQQLGQLAQEMRVDQEIDPHSLAFLDSGESDIPELPREAAPEDDQFVDLNRSSPGVTLRESPFKELPAGADPALYLMLPSMDRAEMNSVLEAVKSVKFKDPSVVKWAEHLGDSHSFHVRGDRFSRTLNREGADFVQVPIYEGLKLDIASPPAPDVRGVTLRGEEALVANARIMGNYGRLQIPCWNSGVWLAVRVAGTDELHELDGILANRTYDFGYMSNGLVYSHTSAISNSILVNWILDRVVGSNLKDSSKANLLKAIRLADLYPLVARYAAAVFPTGFPYGRPCPTGPIKCTHIEKEILRLSKIVVTDMGALKPEQLKHMSTRTLVSKYTLDDLQKYRDHFTIYGDRQVPVKKSESGVELISVVLTSPSLEEYIIAGEEWVNGIIARATQLLAEASTQQQTAYINEQWMLSTMRQYSSWVARVVYPQSENVVEDRDAIEKVLHDLSKDTDVATTFIAEVGNYIDDSTVSVVVIPRGKCSACGAMHGDKDGHPYVIPIDPCHAFFTLRDLKIQSTLSAYMAH